MFNLPTLLIATSIFQFSLGLFIYFIFKNLNNRSKYYWLAGTICSATALIIRAFSPDLQPIATVFGATSFSLMGLIFLCFSLDSLFSTSHHLTQTRKYLRIIVVLLIWLLCSQVYLVQNQYLNLSVINSSLTLGGCNFIVYLVARTIVQRVNNHYLRMFANISLIIAMMWFLRVLTIIYLHQHDILGAGIHPASLQTPEVIPNLNFVIFLILVALSSVRIAIFASILITLIENEKQNLLREQINLEAVIKEKTALLKTISTTYKASNLGMMISSLSHELNQPLGSMRIAVDVLKMKLLTIKDPDSELINKLLTSLDKDHVRASNIILRVRDLFQKGQDQFTHLNFSDTINDIINDLSEHMSDQQIALNVQIEPDVFVLADVNQMQMVLLNLINNAIQSVVMQATVRSMKVHLSSQGAFCTLTVEDNGSGIAKDAYKNIFELFYTTKEEGSGIGLWLTKTIMEHHQGSISVDRSDLGGALFTLTLPKSKLSHLY